MGLKKFNKTFSNVGLLGTLSSTRLLPTPEIFLVTAGISTFYKDQGHHISQNYFTEKSFWVKLSLYNLISLPNKLPYIVDGLQYTHIGSKLVLQYNYNFMSSDIRLHIHTNISSANFFCNSLSGIYPSTVWLERELSDFTGLVFQGLTDSRRLLLDYFQEKQTYKSHIHNEKSYNNATYEVLLNF